MHTYLFYLSSLEHGQPGVLSMVASGMFWPAVAPSARPEREGRDLSICNNSALKVGRTTDGRTDGCSLGWGPCLGRDRQRDNTKTGIGQQFIAGFYRSLATALGNTFGLRDGFSCSCIIHLLCLVCWPVTASARCLTFKTSHFRHTFSTAKS